MEPLEGYEVVDRVGLGLISNDGHEIPVKSGSELASLASSSAGSTDHRNLSKTGPNGRSSRTALFGSQIS